MIGFSHSEPELTSQLRHRPLVPMGTPLDQRPGPKSHIFLSLWEGNFAVRSQLGGNSGSCMMHLLYVPYNTVHKSAHGHDHSHSHSGKVETQNEFEAN